MPIDRKALVSSEGKLKISDDGRLADKICCCECTPKNLHDFNNIAIALSISGSNTDCVDEELDPPREALSFSFSQSQGFTRVDRDFDLNADPADCSTFQLWNNCFQDLITGCSGLGLFVLPDGTPEFSGCSIDDTPFGSVFNTIVGVGPEGVSLSTNLSAACAFLTCVTNVSPVDSVAAPATAAALAGTTVTISGTITSGGITVDYTLNVTYSV